MCVCVCVCVCVLCVMCVCACKPPHEQNVKQGQYLSEDLTGLNDGFSFSWLG